MTSLSGGRGNGAEGKEARLPNQPSERSDQVQRQVIRFLNKRRL
jgi:hypothetical protein